MIRGSIFPSARLSRGLALVAFASVALAPALGHAAPQRAQPSKVPDPSTAQTTVPADAAPSSRDAPARARMLECGHQWNNMKRAGTASGTWKDFSRGCLAQR